MGILQGASLILQIVASFITIITAFIAYFQQDQKMEKGDVYEGPKYPLGHKEVFPSLKWVLISAFFLYYFASITFICVANVPSTALLSTAITFLVMSASFLFLYIKGKDSLETRTILAPKGLWQMMSNKIPAYLEECDGPFRINIVKIGMYNAEDGKDNECQTGAKINKLVQGKINKIRAEKECQTFLGRDTRLYEIIEDDSPFYQRTNSNVIHGIIVFIGDRISSQQARAQISHLADKFPNTPIGYVSYGTYPSDGYIPPFINLKGLREEDYIDHLIFRYYARSHAWKKLADSYHKYLTIMSIVLAILLFIIPTGILVRNVSSEKSKIVRYAPKPNNKKDDFNKKNDFTQLANYLLVNPSPKDVKLWKKQDSTCVNIVRYSEMGKTSSKKSWGKSLISHVMDAQVFLLYDPSRNIPYTVWQADGQPLDGKYDRRTGVYSVYMNSTMKYFKWEQSREGMNTFDDKYIRMMYSYDGKEAVEVIYSPQEGKAVRNAARYSDNFLLSIQQMLVFSQLDSLNIGKQMLEAISQEVNK